MKSIVLSDFTSNSEISLQARQFLKEINNKVDIQPVCVKNTNNKLVGESDIVIQFLEKEKLIRLPNKINIAVGTYDYLGEFSNIVDYVWDDLNLPINLNDGIINIPHLAGEYVFYTINDNYDKSLTNMIIRAFTKEFDPAEPANLIIKTDRIIDREILEIKKSIGLYKDINAYKKQVVISKKYTDGELCGIHNSFDCYIESDDNDQINQKYCKKLNKQCILGTSSLSESDLMASMREEYKYRNREFDNHNEDDEDVVDYIFRKLGEIYEDSENNK